jgi:hypothetical protein
MIESEIVIVVVMDNKCAIIIASLGLNDIDKGQNIISGNNCTEYGIKNRCEESLWSLSDGLIEIGEGTLVFAVCSGEDERSGSLMGNF